MSSYAMTTVNGMEARQLDYSYIDEGRTRAAVYALPSDGTGLITVGTDRFAYPSPSAALIEWFRWLFSVDDEKSQAPAATK
jgi:hypothetical protein